MSCKNQQTFLAAFAYGDVSETERAELERHLKDCASCSR
ncbi:MAG: zf-HC2 domain-containing protein, partial [Elusimicrobia bacterium]|nr:zf-HC2 domain-containing protein [Elusimicrobiota bacterium]